MKKKNSLLLLITTMCLLLVITACGNNNNNTASPSPSNTSETDEPKTETPQPEPLEPVELIWYVGEPAVPADLQAVQDEANKIIQAKINATVKLVPVGFGDYTQKMNTVVASGEQADIIWTASWNFNYVENQNKGAFLPLNDLLAKYAPDVQKSMPQFVWDATKINGQIYAVPNYQTVTNREGFIIQKQYIDKYNLDVSKLKSLEDLEPFLEQVKAGEKAEYVYGMDRKGSIFSMPRINDLEPVVNYMAYIRPSNPDKVINLYETPEYLKYLETVNRWYEKGYINQDAATIKNIADILKTGKSIFSFHNVLKPGGEAEDKVRFGDNEVVYVPISEAYAGTNTIITTMQAINAKSENPERAMMLINLVNTDKELYNLLAYGIEGKHYTKNADGTIKINKDGGYVMADWTLGNVFNGYTLEGKSPAVAEETRKLNESATPSAIIGFVFQPAAVSAEIANVNSVLDEYGPGLNTGTIAAKDKLAEFQDKLKKAGIDTIIAETQRQLDEWNKTK